jgi:alcohol dehydrogenase
LEQPDDLAARAAMQLGAAFAGTAIELSMLGAAHAAANPLTAHFDMIHGQAVGMMLPHVVRFNAEDPSARATYRELAMSVGLVENGAAPANAVNALITRLKQLLTAADMPSSLADGGVAPDVIPILAIEAAAQWTAQFNPRSIAAADFAALYRAAWTAGLAPSSKLDSDDDFALISSLEEGASPAA